MNSGSVPGVRIGAHLLPNNVFAAPMAGVTDRPFRKLCKALGAGYAVSEMVTSRRELWNSLKTSRRADHTGEPGPIAVQIAGTDAAMMAEAATYNVERGAQIIDINMGCPAKKVCNKWAGSALMQDEALALEIAEAVVAACEPHGVPVTLKMRTGWCQSNKNAVTLARAFEGAGIRMLTVHGRTREQGYGGQAEYDTIAAVKAAVRVPVVANGDITSPEKAQAVLAHTGADAVMIGRAAQGRPWIFREVAHYLATGEHLAPPLVAEVQRLLLDHLLEHYALYGDESWTVGLAGGLNASSSTGGHPGATTGVRSARKHIGWYVRGLPGGEAFRARMNALDDSRSQWQAVADYFDELGSVMDRLPAADAVLPGPVEEEAPV
ncbi:tRNA dihydrouridine synthase DusB [Hylemonella gracilis]|uniref:tRNA-dihydrouridine synthase B n=1 Tax=Hylemonella gracilis TaxID=80880 RepID=A0A4P6UGE8_9BURK|nr:tRNA dihydrouridine synthase DusB [Hylemonella gracilis]QBK04308.1 tRNA dihydrouridine synthase DusB [Hylemonella gracilis]